MRTTDTDASLSELDRRLVWMGFRQTVPIAVFVMVFGAAFGLAAMQAGLSPSWIVLMSTTVFAGAAQFAVLDLWGPQMPIMTLAATVFAINARHLLMGASLYPWLRHVPTARRYGVMLVASDVNWAMSMQALNRGQPGLGVLLGGGLALWSFWVAGTWMGTHVGSAIQDPKRFGLDMVMGCFFVALVVGGRKNLRMVVIWIVAACASLMAHRYLPDNSHVVVGALAGGLLGAFWTEGRHEH
ncbi:MAG: AzlC family ABC transporter permease [Burkholderiaceae bacterium]|nr:AzlC family ABC transporter permease [Burkholderiaceae bacterium]